MNKLQCTCRTYFTNKAQTMICVIPFIDPHKVTLPRPRIMINYLKPDEVSVKAVLCCGTVYP